MRRGRDASELAQDLDVARDGAAVRGDLARERLVVDRPRARGIAVRGHPRQLAERVRELARGRRVRAYPGDGAAGVVDGLGSR